LLSYYRCERCGTSQKPWDRLLGLSERALTPAAAQVVAQAGVLASFAEASQRTLTTMSGLKVSESTVERTTEAAGQRVRQLRAAGQTQGPSRSWSWQRDAAGQSCAYISLDHTGVRQQGPGGSRADGKMVPVAMVYNPRSDHDPRKPQPRQVRYVSGFYELDDVGRHLRLPAAGDILSQSLPSDGLSDVPHQRLADWQRPRGVGLQNGGGQSAQRRRHALGPAWQRCSRTTPRRLPQRTNLLAIPLAHPRPSYRRTKFLPTKLTLTPSKAQSPSKTVCRRPGIDVHVRMER